MNKLLLFAILLTFCITFTTRAQAPNDLSSRNLKYVRENFFENELVTNGGADNGTNGWTPVESGFYRGVTDITYSGAEFTDSGSLPQGMTFDDKLFYGGRGDWLSGGNGDNAASYQIITIPQEAYEAINGGYVTANASALIGGYLKQNDYAQVVFYFRDSNGNELNVTTLAAVKAKDRENKTSMIRRSSSLLVPVGTTNVKVEIQIYEQDMGYEVNGYVDNISLIFRERMAKPELSTEKSRYDYLDNITIMYEDMPGGYNIEVYKNMSLIPLKNIYAIGGSLEYNSGSFNISGPVEPGEYTVKCVNNKGEQRGNSIKFYVDNIPFSQNGKKIFVMSDIHVMSPSLLIKEGEAFEEYLNSDRKLLKESMNILKSMTDSVIASNPDLLIIPGDLTKDGELASHNLVASYLKKIKDSGIKTIVVPGNHDINNPHALVYNGSDTEYAETVTPDKFAEIYNDYGYGSAISRDENSISYSCEPISGIVFICIDACRYYDNKFINRGDDKDECVTDGAIKPETLAWIKKEAQNATNAGKQVFAVMHHNIVEHFNKQASIASPYVVADAENIRETFMLCGINVVFTGHFHISDIAKDYNSDKSDFIYDVSTGSVVTYPCPFREITLNADNTEMSIQSRLLKNIDNIDTDGKDFDLYARDKVYYGIEPMVRGLVSDYWESINNYIDEFLSKYPVGAFINRPKTAEEMSNLLIDNFGEVAQKIYLTFSEGNEQFKLTDSLIAEVKTGVENLVNQVVSSIGQSIAMSMVKDQVYPIIDEVIGSIIGNITNYGTDKAILINDLYTSISLHNRGEGFLKYIRKDCIAGEYNTIYLPYKAYVDNALTYSVAGIDSRTEPEYLYLEKRDVLDAGIPYIFSAKEDGDVTFTYRDENKSETSFFNGLQGVLYNTKVNAGKGLYCLETRDDYESKSTLYQIAEDGYECFANNAYLNILSTPVLSDVGNYRVRIPFCSIETGVEESNLSDCEESDIVDVYTIYGVKIRNKVAKSDATKDLPAGIYIVGGKKAIVKP